MRPRWAASGAASTASEVTGRPDTRLSGSDLPRRKPEWLKQKAPAPRQFRATGALLDELELHTVCREARCPNKGECFAAGTATFLILGDVCTRACTFCAVEGEGKTAAATAVCGLDEDEPRRVAEASRRLGLRHVVVTSVTRDDLPDGGAAQFAAVIVAVRDAVPEATVEVLIPDLGGDEAALAAVLAARPDVLNHNLETVPRLYPQVRPQARYERSLELLARAAAWAREPGRAAPGAAPPAAARPRAQAARPHAHTAARPLVKTGLMVGLGETGDEVAAVLADAAASGVDAVTVGQYLRPHAGCLPVARYVTPREFSGYERHGEGLGLTVVAAPFVRSSYRAGELLERGA